jgi:hypothetical protein
MPPIVSSALRRKFAPSSRFISSVIVCCADTSWPSSLFATSASCFDDWYLPRSALRSPRSCESLSSSSDTTICAPELAIQDLGRAANLLELLLELQHLALQILAGLLVRLRLAELAQHEQQDDRPERAADRVEERHAEHGELATRERLLMASPSRGS